MTSRAIMWFRRDLRLRDNPALGAALAAGDVLPLFVIDPAFDGAGAPRQALLHDCLRALDGATGGALIVRRGDPVDEVPAIADEIDASTVFVAKDFGPYGRRRDEQVADTLVGGGRRLRGVGSPYAVEPGRVVKDDGDPYSVFTPFSRRWRDHGWDDPIDAPRSPDWIEAPSDGLPERPDAGIDIPSATEENVIARWRRFRDGGLDDYGNRRNFPAVEGTSRLSPYLKYGVVHPRQLLAESDARNESHKTFQSELAWRDFYADVLHRRPQTAWENLDRRFDAIELDTDAAARERFERWCAGRTGFPIVDAGMRQLVESGWMHNRVRMIVASFLVKDLHLPWWWGARFFLRHLLDGDLASNNHGWQWAAGTGTDAAPYFRVFNPTAQGERWDPDGEYVARWIPELGTSDYPDPMVDHKAEREEALARFQAVKARR
ncbi:cryptochrome/photolyase family protein [Ilumatobacter sp.]|uniref:cryptochrome/photolyase family protein n=1 Tax=Ilumatobacter sp. TaxID=1967498 RepID=UPI003AF811B2